MFKIFKKEYHKFRFDIYELAMEYSYFFSKLLKELRNSKNDDLQIEIFSSLCNFINGVPKKNKYDKERLKRCLLSSFGASVEKDVIELFDNIATFCCDYSKFEPHTIGNILGEINGFKW